MHSICLIDEDLSLGQMTCRNLQQTGEFNCLHYSTYQEMLLSTSLEYVDCVIASFRRPEIEGLALQAQLNLQDPSLGTVMIVGDADITTVVTLLKQGAVHILQRPYQNSELVQAIRTASKRTSSYRERWSQIKAAKGRYERLTEEERNVVDLLVAGVPNKTIPIQLNMSPRTFDRRKQSALVSMEVDSVVDLARLMTLVVTFEELRNIDRGVGSGLNIIPQAAKNSA